MPSFFPYLSSSILTLYAPFYLSVQPLYPLSPFWQLHDVVVAHARVGDVAKSRIVERLALADKALIDGSDEELQLLDVAAFCMQTWRAVA